MEDVVYNIMIFICKVFGWFFSDFNYIIVRVFIDELVNFFFEFCSGYGVVC